ncbi:carbon-nitrogen hydrolase family protein, partial [Pseudomonas aeruginosa]|nr:carbon-nitrogen hydrolase family protein [Pseudomonas aeruginosa]
GQHRQPGIVALHQLAHVAADIRRRMPVVAHRRFFPPAEPRPARTE